MSDYIVYFSIIALMCIFYIIYYKKYIFAPKMQMLNVAKEFRYARNLNTELISLLWLNTSKLQNTGNVFNGLTFEATLNDLQTQRDVFYTTSTFKQLVGKQKTNRGQMDALQVDIFEYIKMQHQVKANFSKALSQLSKVAA